MLNRRVKEGIKNFHKKEVHINFSLGTLAIVAVCFMLMIISTFTQIKMNFNLPEAGLNTYLKFEYIPQIPVVIFIAALLGEFWGLFTILLFIIAGLTHWCPFFALGGGLSYVFQYNFGYIFAFIFGVIFSAKELKKRNSIVHIILAVLYGVGIIHIIGIVYMTILALLRHDSFDFIGNWIYYQSLSKILYDIVFSFILILVAKGIRKFLWIITG